MPVVSPSTAPTGAMRGASSSPPGGRVARQVGKYALGGAVVLVALALALSFVAFARVGWRVDRLEALGASSHGIMPAVDGDVESAGQRFEELTQRAKQFEAEMRALEGELAGLRQQQTALTGDRRAVEAQLETARKVVAEALTRLVTTAK